MTTKTMACLAIVFMALTLQTGDSARKAPVAAPLAVAAPATPDRLVLAAPPQVTAKAAAAPAYTKARCGNSSGRMVLSFDDWAYGDPYRATRTGAVLKKRHIRAMFFLVNEQAKRYPDIISTLRQQGHWVLNHTYSHQNLTKVSKARARWQIQNGIKTNMIRFPYLATNKAVNAEAKKLGYRSCSVTIVTNDTSKFSGKYRSVSSIRAKVRNASAAAKKNGMILGHLHTNYPDAIGGIIDDMHKEKRLFCYNSGPVGANVPFPLTCT